MVQSPTLPDVPRWKTTASREVTHRVTVEPTPVTPIESSSRFCAHNADLDKKIAARAYEIFERRGKGDGQDVADWLRAEAELVWELH